MPTVVTVAPTARNASTRGRKRPGLLSPSLTEHDVLDREVLGLHDVAREFERGHEVGAARRRDAGDAVDDVRSITRAGHRQDFERAIVEGDHADAVVFVEHLRGRDRRLLREAQLQALHRSRSVEHDAETERRRATAFGRALFGIRSLQTLLGLRRIGGRSSFGGRGGGGSTPWKGSHPGSRPNFVGPNAPTSLGGITTSPPPRRTWARRRRSTASAAEAARQACDRRRPCPRVERLERAEERTRLRAQRLDALRGEHRRHIVATFGRDKENARRPRDVEHDADRVVGGLAIGGLASTPTTRRPAGSARIGKVTEDVPGGDRKRRARPTSRPSTAIFSVPSTPSVA
jgi:hypothetical protein